MSTARHVCRKLLRSGFYSRRLCSRAVRPRISTRLLTHICAPYFDLFDLGFLPSLADEDYILLIDADMIMRRPVLPQVGVQATAAGASALPSQPTAAGWQPPSRCTQAAAC